MYPPSRAFQPGWVIRNVPVLEPTADGPVEEIDRGSERAKVTTERARNGNAKRQNPGRPRKRLPVENLPGQRRRNTDERVNHQKPMSRDVLFVTERSTGELFRVRPTHAKEHIEKDNQAYDLDAPSNGRTPCDRADLGQRPIHKPGGPNTFPPSPIAKEDVGSTPSHRQLVTFQLVGLSEGSAISNTPASRTIARPDPNGGALLEAGNRSTRLSCPAKNTGRLNETLAHQQRSPFRYKELITESAKITPY